MTTQTDNPWLLKGSLIAVLLLGFCLRLFGLQFGSPLTVHPEESLLMDQAMDAGARMGHPGGFENPSAMVYFTLALQGVRYLVSDAVSPAEYWTNYAGEPFSYHLWGRVGAVLFGVLGIFAVYLLGREWEKGAALLPGVGILSALLLSVHFLHVRDSRFATIDIPVATGITLVLLLLMREIHRGETNIRRMLGIALLTGVCCGIHYTALPLVVPLLYVAAANVIRTEGLRIDPAWLFGAGMTLLAGVGAGFLAATPYAMLDSTGFWEDIRFLFFSKVTGTPIDFNESPFLLGYLQGPWMWGGGTALGVLSFFGLMMALLRREREDRLLLAFALPYYLLISLGEGVWGRLFLPLSVLQIVWAVRFLGVYADHPSIVLLVPASVRVFLTAFIVAVLALTNLLPSVRQAVLLRGVDTRVEASERIEGSVNNDDYLLFTPGLPPIPREIPRKREEGLLPNRKTFDQGSRLMLYSIPPLESFIEEGVNKVLYSSFYWETAEQPWVGDSRPEVESYRDFLRDLRLHGREVWRISPSNDPVPFHPEDQYAPTFHLWGRLRPGPEIILYDLPDSIPE